MKILIVHEKFPPDVTGGGENLMYQLAKGLIQRGHYVTVITTGNPKIKSYDGIPTIRIPINRYLMNLAFSTILKYSKSFDVIQTTSGNGCLAAWLAAKILNKPICCLILHYLSSYWRDVKGIFLGLAFQFIENIYLDRSYDAMVLMSRHMERMFKGFNVNTEKYLLSPGPTFNSSKKIKKQNIALFVGNLGMNKTMVKLKGLDNLIKAAEYLQDIEFHVVGKGELLDELRRHSPRNVLFKGALFKGDLKVEYQKAAIFCLPSLSEGFSFSILDAMVAGCAIVSTIDIGQKGIMVKPKSIADLTNAIKHLSDNPKLVNRFGNVNRRLAKQHTWHRFVDGFIEIYRKISK